MALYVPCEVFPALFHVHAKASTEVGYVLLLASNQPFERTGRPVEIAAETESRSTTTEGGQPPCVHALFVQIAILKTSTACCAAI